MASTTSPNVRPMPTWDTAPPATSLMIMAPVPANTRENVPKNSAASFFMNGSMLILPRLKRRPHRTRYGTALDLRLPIRTDDRQAGGRVAGGRNMDLRTQVGWVSRVDFPRRGRDPDPEPR